VELVLFKLVVELKQPTDLIQFFLQSLHQAVAEAVVITHLEILTLVVLVAVVIGTHLVVLVIQEVILQ
jgi:hypothetical protein